MLHECLAAPVFVVTPANAQKDSACIEKCNRSNVTAGGGREAQRRPSEAALQGVRQPKGKMNFFRSGPYPAECEERKGGWKGGTQHLSGDGSLRTCEGPHADESNPGDESRAI
jgi:hypothetical protein